MNDINVINRQLNNKIYTLSQSISIKNTSNKWPRISDVTNIYLWHCRLGHVKKNRINRLLQKKILKVNDCESLSICESCLLEKIIKSPFTEKGEQASEVLGLIHIDVCKSMNISARGDYYYCITFRDDLSRYGYVYLMTYK